MDETIPQPQPGVGEEHQPEAPQETAREANPEDTLVKLPEASQVKDTNRTENIEAETSPEPEKSSLAAWVQEHYAPLYRLAFAGLYHAGAAHQVALLALVERKPEALYRTALKLIHEESRRREKKAPTVEEGETPATTERVTGGAQGIAPMVAAYGEQERLLMALCYALGWQPAEAARLLHVGASAARAQIDLFRKDLRPVLGDEAEASPEGAPTRTVSELRAMQEAVLDRRIRKALEALWPAPVLDEAGLAALAVQVQEVAGERIPRRPGVPAEAVGLPRAGRESYRWLALVGGALLLGLLCLCALGSLLAGGRLAVNMLNPTPLVTPYGAPTAVIPVPRAEPLTRRSSGDDIRARIQESSTLWRTLWVEAQSLQYGPQSYLGAPRAYQAQAWIRQPDKSSELFGLLTESPNVFYWVNGNRLIYFNALFNLVARGRWTGETHHMLANQPLQKMIFPSESLYADPQAYFKSIGIEQVAGRRALLAEWYTPVGLYQARLWLDVQTGVILRQQTFGPDQKLITSDSWVTAIGYDQNFPPAGLNRIAEAPEGNPTPAPTLAAPLPTPALAYNPERRITLPLQAAPPGFDSSNRSLIFQLSSKTPFANSQGETAEAPFELFVDGYWIGSAKFGLPWFLRCNRSPDGLKLGYSSGTDGTAQADEELRWLDLGKPAVFYKVLPGFKVPSFAFAPDSHRLAAFGKGMGKNANGVFVVDTATGEYSLIIEIDQASSLAWSPDGEFLAFIGEAPYLEGPTLFVIHLRTKTVTYQSEPGAVLDPLPEDAPVLDWEIDFPVEMGGMDECAAPPQ